MGFIVNNSLVDFDKLKRLLKAHRIFADLSADELQRLCDVCSLKIFDENNDLIKEEEPNHFLYLIIEGEVDIKSYGRKVDSRFAGSLMGVISAAGLGSMTEDSATVEVVAATPVKAVCFPIDVVHELTKANKKFSETLYDEAMSRLLR